MLLKRINYLPVRNAGVPCQFVKRLCSNPVSYTHLDVYKRQLYNKLETILDENESLDSDKPVHLTRFTLHELGLDCFSGQDADFIKELSIEWFNREVSINYFNFYGMFY